MELDYKRLIEQKESTWILDFLVRVTRDAFYRANIDAEQPIHYAQFVSYIVLAIFKSVTSGTDTEVDLPDEQMLSELETCVFRVLLGVIREGGFMPPAALDEKISGTTAELRSLENILRRVGRDSVVRDLTDSERLSPPGLLSIIGYVSSLFSNVLPVSTTSVLWDIMFEEYSFSDGKEFSRSVFLAICVSFLIISSGYSSFAECPSEVEIQGKISDCFASLRDNPASILAMALRVLYFMAKKDLLGGA